MPLLQCSFIFILIVMLTMCAHCFISYTYLQLHSRKILIPVWTCICTCIVIDICKHKSATLFEWPQDIVWVQQKVRMWYHIAVYVLIDSTNAGMMEHSFTINSVIWDWHAINRWSYVLWMRNWEPYWSVAVNGATLRAIYTTASGTFIIS